MTAADIKETRGIATAAFSFAASTYVHGKGYLPSVVADNLTAVEERVVAEVESRLDSKALVSKLDSACDAAVDYVEEQPAYKSVVALPENAEYLVEKYLPASDDEEETEEKSEKKVAFIPRITNLSGTVSRRVRKKAFKGLNDLQLRAKDVVHVDLIAYANSLDKENYMGKIKDKTTETIEYSKVMVEEKLVEPAKTAYTEWVMDELSGKPSAKKVMSVVGETYDERVAPVVKEYKEKTLAYYKEKKAVVYATAEEQYNALTTAVLSVYSVITATMDPYFTPAKDVLVDYLNLLNVKITNLYTPVSEKVLAFYTKQYEASLELYQLALKNEKVIAATNKAKELYSKALEDERFAAAQKKASEYFNLYFAAKVKDE